MSTPPSCIGTMASSFPNDPPHLLSPDEPASDIWSDWLLGQRHGQDPEYQALVQKAVLRYAHRLLDGAQLAPGMTLVDLGSGEGLIPFEAIRRIGPSLQVVLSDISAPMLRHAREQAERLGVAAQCRFVQSPADDLRALDSGLADVLTSRSVLAYVADKKAALAECFRVLKPGGRLSIAEPVFQDDALAVCALKQKLDAEAPGLRDPAQLMLHRWKSAQFPDTHEKIAADPLTQYNERTLLHFAQAAGFTDAHLELHIDQRPADFNRWETFLDMSPIPGKPTLRTILDTQFSADERSFFECSLRPAIESGKSQTLDRMAYLQARKPLS